MAEEHRCQATEGHIPCVNNCGFFGSPTTMNLCSKCFREQESTKSTIETALSSSSAAASTTTVPSPAPSTSSPPPQPITAETSAPQPVELASSSITVSVVVAANPRARVQPNRCAECRKRVGLTGFKCRCGVTFCGTHRYPEKHACSFDFKTVGREEIARANPVIKAEKLERI